MPDGEEVRKLIRYVDHYLEIIAPLELEPEAFVFVRRWLEEAFASWGIGSRSTTRGRSWRRRWR